MQWLDGFHVLGVYAAVNALLALVLGMLVTRARVKTQTPIGDGAGNPALAGPFRAHANNAEYVPLVLVMMVIINSLGGAVWIIHAVGLPLTIGRVLHAIALSRNVGPSTLRVAGMMLTWIAEIIAIGCCLLLAVLPAAMAF
jgi:uncharacterized membrane protein YecN with MAPEG domain